MTMLSKKQKEMLKEQIKKLLSNEEEVQRIVVFGSFVGADEPNDIDIAVFQNSDTEYLSLSLKYRKLLRSLITTIPYDVIPIHSHAKGHFLEHIKSGDVIFER